MTAPCQWRLLDTTNAQGFPKTRNAPKQTWRRSQKGDRSARWPSDLGPRTSPEGSGRNLKESGKLVPTRFPAARCQEVKAARYFWPQTPLPPPPGRPAGPQAGKGQGHRGPRGSRAGRPPRPRPRTTAARQPGASQEEGPRPRPAPKPRGQNRNLTRREGNAARPGPALPAAEPLRRAQRDGRPLPEPRRGPSRRAGPTSRHRPLPAPPRLPACPPSWDTARSTPRGCSPRWGGSRWVVAPPSWASYKARTGLGRNPTGRWRRRLWGRAGGSAHFRGVARAGPRPPTSASRRSRIARPGKMNLPGLRRRGERESGACGAGPCEGRAPAWGAAGAYWSPRYPAWEFGVWSLARWALVVRRGALEALDLAGGELRWKKPPHAHQCQRDLKPC